jgi:hypothetical protein
MSFKRSIIPLHIQYSYVYTWRNSPCFPFLLLTPICSPFVSPSTYLAPSSCDRNRPPQSQVACKLTPFAPPFTQPTPPFQIPRTPTAQRLTKTTSGIFRLLLSGTFHIKLSILNQNRCASYGTDFRMPKDHSAFGISYLNNCLTV